MSQRDSGYERRERDLYETPEWVTKAVIDYVDTNRVVWEPASGSGKMIKVLRAHGMKVYGTDIESGNDFLSFESRRDPEITCIITNPPYVLAQEFIEHALKLMETVEDQVWTVAMLLRTDFDHAKTRRHLFDDCPQFAKKLVLTKRIQWFEDSTGSPSFNHAWFIWFGCHEGPPVLAYDFQP